MTIVPRIIESIDNKIGEVQPSPTANTVLDRLKRITTETLTTEQTHECLGGGWSEPGTLTTLTSIGQPTDYKIDSWGNLSIRGPITTDEGCMREDFPGTTIYRVISGTITFTNSSNVIIGAGTTFTDGKIQYADYIKLSTDADTAYTKIISVISDTELLLEEVYTGATGSGIGYHVTVLPIIGTGGGVAVVSSICTITSGTVNSSLTRITRDIDYCPLVMAVNASFGTRRTNQTGYIGLADDAITPTISAYFQFDGSDNTTIKTVTQFSAQATDIETTTINLLAATTTKKRYKIELAQEYVAFYVDNILVASHKNHIPSPYAYMQLMIGWVNGSTGTVITTPMLIDTIFIANIDVLQTMSGLGNLPAIINNTPISPALITTSDFEIGFTIRRSNNIIPYNINDIINTGSSTTLPEFDFSGLGNLNNRFIELSSVVIISNNGASAATPIVPYIHLFNRNNPGFTVTDNSLFNPTYTQMINSRVLSIGPTFIETDSGDLTYLLTSQDKARIIKLNASSRVYLALVNSTAYTPIANETFRVILKGRL